MVRKGTSWPRALQVLKWPVAIFGLAVLLGSLGLLLFFNFPGGQTFSAFLLQPPTVTAEPTSETPAPGLTVETTPTAEGQPAATATAPAATVGTPTSLLRTPTSLPPTATRRPATPTLAVESPTPPPPTPTRPVIIIPTIILLTRTPTLTPTPTPTPTPCVILVEPQAAGTPARWLTCTPTPTAKWHILTPVLPQLTRILPLTPLKLTPLIPRSSALRPIGRLSAAPLRQVPTPTPEMHQRHITIEWRKHMRIGDERSVRLIFFPEAEPGTPGVVTPQFLENATVTHPAVPLPRDWFEQYHVYAAAELHALAFEHMLIGDPRREVLLDEEVIWQWKVQPRTVGEKEITFSISLSFEPQETTRPGKPDIPVWWSETVRVKVSQPFGLGKQTANMIGAVGLVGGGGLSTPLWLALRGWWRKRQRQRREEDPAWQLESLQQRRQRAVKSLYHLEEQRSKYGIDVPLHIVHQIDDTQAELAQIDQELAALKDELAKRAR